RENAGYQRRVCCSGPGISAKEPQISAGFAAAVCCKSAANAEKKGRHRPAGDRARRSFGLAANPLQMQPDGARDRSVARRKYAEQRDALRQGKAGRAEDRFRGGQREIGGAVAAVIGAEQRKQCLVLVDGYELAVERRPSVGAKIEAKCRDLSDEGLNLGSRSLRIEAHRAAQRGRGQPQRKRSHDRIPLNLSRT